MKLLEMDLWDLHDDPTQVDGHAERLLIPKIAYTGLKSGKLNEREIKIAERGISKSARYSYSYAGKISKVRFPAGEKAISKDAHFSYFYALNALKKNRFPGGCCIVH